ncbi:hypothetical protein ACF0H5_002192 [Mactra antiquata]
MALPNGPLEIVFSFDTTGSMSSCLAEVRGRVSDMVQRLQADIPGIKMAVFAHGDYCDRSNYITKFVDFTDDVGKLVDFANNVSSTGGGDSDECYELVLHEVRTKLSWTPGSQRALVMIGDCNPHEPNYPQNTLKLNWRHEADALNDIGVRIYSVQCHNYDADKFYADIARRTNGHHLKLSDFKNIFDFLMAVCYREKDDTLFMNYEKEVRARPTAINKDLHNLFGDLRDGTTSDLSSDASSSSGTIPLKKAGKTKPTTMKKSSSLIKPTSMTKKPSLTKSPKVRTMKKVPANKKYMEKYLPKHCRENVPENNFLLRDMNWSEWKLVIAPSSRVVNDMQVTVPRTGTGSGYRVSNIFGGKTKMAAIYEVSVQTKAHSRKFVVYSKVCRGFNSGKNWENQLFGRKGVKQQIDSVVKKNCSVYIRRMKLRSDKISDKVRHAMRRYDFAWKPLRSVRDGHRQVTKGDVEISCEMECN